MSKFKKTMILSITIIFVLVMSMFLYAWHRFSSMYVETNGDKKRLEDINRNPTKYKKIEGITNILLVGSDLTPGGDVSHSDAITILTIDSARGKTKLTSILRDALVEIEGHGQEKITHAYAYGGISLLRKTIEGNFDIRLDQYAIIDFGGFIGLIDAVGGVELNIKNEKEVKALNNSLLVVSTDNVKVADAKLPYITKPGIQTLNGPQALAFSRMREVGNGIYDRSRRQREVIEKLLQKVIDTSIVKYPSIGESILPFLKTNVPFKDALSLAYTMGSMGNFNINKLQIPADELNEGLEINKRLGWVNVMDLEANKTVLHDFIFNDIEYDKTQHKQFTFKGSKEQKKYVPGYGEKHTETLPKPKNDVNIPSN